VALSTAKAEYIAARACRAQLLWVTQQLRDLRINLRNVPIRCDNMGAINIMKNVVQHSQKKHIEVCHHFTQYHVERGDVSLEFVLTKSQLGEIFTKPPSEEKFNYTRQKLGMINIDT